jgi:hypothetical protein
MSEDVRLASETKKQTQFAPKSWPAMELAVPAQDNGDVVRWSLRTTESRRRWIVDDELWTPQ